MVLLPLLMTMELVVDNPQEERLSSFPLYPVVGLVGLTLVAADFTRA